MGLPKKDLKEDFHRLIERLENMILTGVFQPRERLVELKLAQELGISRTPLVSALKFLEHEKLVESKPRRGFFVRLFTKQEMISILELREVLEGLAARRAATNITEIQIEKLNIFFKQFAKADDITDIKAYAKEDRRFHNFITEIGAKEFLKSILQTYNIIYASYLFLSSEGLVRTPNETIHEHIEVINAISQRDPDTAEKLMRQHLKKSIASLKQDIEKEDKGIHSGKIIRPSF